MKTTDAGASRSRFIALAACLSVPAAAWAQPYHTDVLSGGVQTLDVDGDLSVKQYGGGYGGNLDVASEAHVGSSFLPLTGMPSGVTGKYYGPLKIGESMNVAEYVFEKEGTNSTGGFIVPLGKIGEWTGATFQLDILTGPHDYDAGAAHFTVMGRNWSNFSDMNTVSHVAFGGAQGVSLYGQYVNSTLYLKYEPSFVHDALRTHRLKVRLTTIGTISPLERGTTFEQSSPVRMVESLASPSSTYGNEMKRKFNAENNEFNGNVAIASGKTLKVGGSDVLTTASAPTGSPAWTSAFVPRGTVAGGAFLASPDSYASGYGASAFGSGTVSLGEGSTSLGVFTEAVGYGTFSAGGETSSTGDYSAAFGFQSRATGDTGFTTGDRTEANGYASFSSGSQNEANGWGASAFGYITRAEGNLTAAFGSQTHADAVASFVLGINNVGGGHNTNWNEEEPLFEAGNGFSGSASNAITTLKNGQTSLTNKAWKGVQNGTPAKALGDPSLSTTDSAGEALVVEGHTRLKGKVVIEVPQGDVSMGIYE